MNGAHSIDSTAMAVFIGFFALVTVLGFVAARWKRGDLTQLHEWGLGGRQFGTVISWFLVGGDFYTAYTVIAVPALVYSVGAYGFFALPYTIIVYPFVFAVMPKLWQIAHAKNHITAADYVHGEYGGKLLPAAIALTGIVATMPYIALQLVGMQVVIKGLGVTGELPLVAAFVILALYTYASGLRAPAMIAFVKDIMIYIVVIAAVWLIPTKLGGYATVFDAADKFFTAKGGATGIILKPSQFTAYASLALGSALAAFMYPHTMTAVLSSSSAKTVRKNAIFLPAYTLLLGLIALLGYMAIAAGIRVQSASDVVPALFGRLFPSWFVGFAAAAIAISALVPAAIMSIGAANLFTRNLWRPLVNPNITPAGEASTAKFISLIVKFGALLFIVFLPTQYAIDLQLLGGVWILQVFPSIVFTLYTRRLSRQGLFCGWLVGIVTGTALAAAEGLKPVVALHLGDATYPVYIGLIALAANIVVTFVLSAFMPVGNRAIEPTRG
ncbi:Acetate permease ActP (cation/acetate symporter) [Caballeronia glathei]|jgi:SSS family solute:Na+ symporter|uniref:Sodium:solute symporter n=1 Tax=Caballeronia glathei TaxID=60547 RepID=A0A069Q3F7_9BURK|nr:MULTISPECIES: sodium:solute symporter [Burkholderiaceae]KDR44326.1 sodium:solute symporter [Caballeronia glathei]TCK34511.1 SSS family solute:Na+ symporter [Paraburkholderia sp. BL8N3]CDY77614.1 Acetate permease ActP (cation/acetate symporter) [Caballeronia glathei]